MDGNTRALLREKEWRLCQLSFPYFFANHWRIVLPESNDFGLPEVRPEQIETAEAFQKHNRVVVLKARQIGWTTVVTSYLFWKAFFLERQATLALSRREDPEALLIITALKFGYEGLEPWMQDRGPAMVKDTMTKAVFKNRSSVESDASKDNPARGRTLQLLIMDEFGRFPDPEGAWGSALPSVEWGQLIVIGNADYRDSSFHKLYVGGKEGKNNFKSFFYPWTVVPGRDAQWLAEQTSSMSPAQIAAEYPTNDEECWISAGSPVFDSATILTRTPHVGVSGSLVRAGGSWEFRHAEADDGFLKIWRHPVIGHKYGIGVDTARGLEYGDDSASIVLDHQERHCATLYGKIPPSALAAMTAELGEYYNRALIGVETNNVGATTLDYLIRTHRYRNLYVREGLNTLTTMTASKFGWDTNEKTKALMINWLAARLEHMDIIDSDVLSQLLAYRYLGDGKMGGSPHDDLVIALALAAQMVRKLRAPVDTTEAEVPVVPPSRFEGFNGTYAAHARLDMPDESRGAGKDLLIMGSRRARRN